MKRSYAITSNLLAISVTAGFLLSRPAGEGFEYGSTITSYLESHGLSLPGQRKFTFAGSGWFALYVVPVDLASRTKVSLSAARHVASQALRDRLSALR